MKETIRRHYKLHQYQEAILPPDFDPKSRAPSSIPKPPTKRLYDLLLTNRRTRRLIEAEAMRITYVAVREPSAETTDS